MTVMSPRRSEKRRGVRRSDIGIRGIAQAQTTRGTTQRLAACARIQPSSRVAVAAGATVARAAARMAAMMMMVSISSAPRPARRTPMAQLCAAEAGQRKVRDAALRVDGEAEGRYRWTMRRFLLGAAAVMLPLGSFVAALAAAAAACIGARGARARVAAVAQRPLQAQSDARMRV